MLKKIFAFGSTIGALLSTPAICETVAGRDHPVSQSTAEAGVERAGVPMIPWTVMHTALNTAVCASSYPMAGAFDGGVLIAACAVASEARSNGVEQVETAAGK